MANESDPENAGGDGMSELEKLKNRVSSQRDEIARLYGKLAQMEYEMTVTRMALLMATTYPEDWMKKAKARVSNRIRVNGMSKMADPPAPVESLSGVYK